MFRFPDICMNSVRILLTSSQNFTRGFRLMPLHSFHPPHPTTASWSPSLMRTSKIQLPSCVLEFRFSNFKMSLSRTTSTAFLRAVGVIHRNQKKVRLCCFRFSMSNTLSYLTFMTLWDLIHTKQSLRFRRFVLRIMTYSSM